MVKSRRMRWAGNVARMWERRNACRILVGKPEGRPLGRRRRRWVDNIKMEFRDIGWDSMDWISLAQDRDQWSALVNKLKLYFVLRGIFDMYTGANCSTLVTEGIHQMLSAVWVVQELNRQNFIPGVTLGLLLYDACSEPLTAQKALKTGLQETVCLSTYPSGVVTTPSISTHLQELVATAHLPVFVTSSEYPAVVSTLTASLLSALNWSQVAITLAPSTEYISTFGQAASREDICVHHQASFADRHSSIWATAFQASEPRQKGNVALVFGSTNEILRTVQVARDDNTASTLQWVLVPLNIPQELSFLGPTIGADFSSQRLGFKSGGHLYEISGERSGTEAEFSLSFFGFSLPAFLPLLLITHLTLPPQVWDNPEHSLAQHLAGCREDELYSVSQGLLWVMSGQIVALLRKCPAFVFTRANRRTLDKVSFVSDDPYHRGLICGSRIFGTNVSYALLFSIMLSRSFMLASCDQDGGFMSHVNGYLQTVLCFFIAGVQLALSVQFWAINSSFLGSRQCSSIYDGHLFLFLLSYDIFLLLLLVCTSPFIARSKRNYQEGIFFTVASFLCLITFIGWIAAYVFVPRHWQDAAITGGLIGTATVILVTVFIPRTYLMMTAIVRDHLASALPSLAYTSTTSIQDINYRSTQVLYDTVTPHPLIHTPEVTGQANPNFYSEQPQSPVQSDPGTSIKQASSEIGFGDRRTVSSENTYARYDTPPSPHKVTRF
ncbi:hypothetical protein B7P43_G04608 [Cryptotermes secundus]|uniref:G-protein coupled receptors family 3 profile domain-containing protein n=1 Tax=Cryptotermes secundus TaxID=105785 RepID=A0A2J7PI82_9NEOP|nr:hypothetical protein B7P43_G04608 [Cryptotermes secundus]